MTEKEVQKVIQDIKDLKIQGNTNIAKTVAKTILDYITHYRPHSFEHFVQQIKLLSSELANARPNEPLSVNAVAFITKDIEKCTSQQEIRIKVIDRIQNFFKYIDESYEIIRVNAVNLLQGHKVFFTHCHSSLSRDILIWISETNPDILVINDETRPLYQGRITATKLSEAKVKVLHTVDSAVASVFLDSKYPKPEVVVVGCDGITIDGGLVNKVGTLNIALAAKEAGVPFYAVTQSMKIDLRTMNDEVNIEQRDKDEVWKERPSNIEILNPAFDLVPAKYITGGYITEKGLLKPEDFQSFVL